MIVVVKFDSNILEIYGIILVFFISLFIIIKYDVIFNMINIFK